MIWKSIKCVYFDEGMIKDDYLLVFVPCLIIATTRGSRSRDHST